MWAAARESTAIEPRLNDARGRLVAMTKQTKRWFRAVAMAMLVAAMMPLDASAQVPTSQVPVLKQALLQFEANVQWTAVAPQWAAVRPAWLQSVNAASSPRDVAAQVLRLEMSMGWSAVAPAWHQQRPAWVQSLRGDVNEAAVARGLLVLEGATQWTAVIPAWRGVRSNWVSTLRAIVGT